MGRYTLELPDSLWQAAHRLSKEQRVSVNQLFTTAIAEKISAMKADRMYRQALDRVPDIPPVHEQDRLD